MDQAQANELLQRLHGEVIGYKFTVPRQRQRPTPSILSNGYQGFFSLPAELRNYIYSMVSKPDVKQILSILKLPGVCRASHRLRQESLPIFFGQNTFIIEVAAPAVLCEIREPGILFHSTRMSFFRTADSRYEATGTLIMRPETEDLPRSTEVVMRNLDLVPLNFDTPPGWKCMHLNAVISPRMSENAGGPRHIPCHCHGSIVGDWPTSNKVALQRDLEYIAEPAAAFLRSKIARADCEGLNQTELGALARKIRVVPPTGPDAELEDLM